MSVSPDKPPEPSRFRRLHDRRQRIVGALQRLNCGGHDRFARVLIHSLISAGAGGGATHFVANRGVDQLIAHPDVAAERDRDGNQLKRQNDAV